MCASSINMHLKCLNYLVVTVGQLDSRLLGEVESGGDECNRWKLERSRSCHGLLEQRGACHYLLVCLDLISIPLKGNAEILLGRIRPLQTSRPCLAASE